jgi:non-specific serine/threonine protein kinase/serine/threonine-protein kinase
VPAIGSRIGAFRLVAPVGTGGMSAVFLAERDDGAFRQRVAIKLISAPLTHPATIRRFRAERQILASLRHPHIVTLLDGGVTPDGQAFLVMEYVDGAPISTYCRERALPLEARLRLFRLVCSAVHYAHRHFVVHRDLKPANILVTSEGEPKVLDFGVAKLLDEGNAPAAATVTAPGAGPLTPNYASPEQLRGLPVTTSSDVYALGVLLYELVTGVRPYETAAKPLDEVLRLVADAEAPRPSSRTDGAAGVPYDVRRALKGDVDAIVSCAMRKEPDRRYASVDELGADIDRFLGGKPVQAREPSLGYVVRKLAAAHRTVFVGAGVAIALIIAALVAALWQGRIAMAQRQQAERRFNEVRELANTLIFRIHDEVEPLAGSTPVRRTIVAEALKYLERLAPDARGDPGLQLELSRAYVQIGKVQGAPGAANLGDRENAVASFEKARQLIRERAVGQDAAPDVAAHYVEASRHLSATLRLMAGRRGDALTIAREAVSLAEQLAARRPGEDRVRAMLASAYFHAAIAESGPAALEHWKKAGAVYGSLLADKPDDRTRQRNVALVEKYLADYYTTASELPLALEHHRRALALDERRLAAEPGARLAMFDVAIDLSNVALIVYKLGNLREAAAYYERSLALRKALAAGDPQDTLAQSRVAYVEKQLSLVYRELGDLPRAFELANAALAIYESRKGAADLVWRTEHALMLEALGNMESDRGRRREACAGFARAWSVLRELSDSDVRAVLAPGVDARRRVARSAAACGVAVELPPSTSQ